MAIRPYKSELRTGEQAYRRGLRDGIIVWHNTRHDVGAGLPMETQTVVAGEEEVTDNWLYLGRSEYIQKRSTDKNSAHLMVIESPRDSMLSKKALGVRTSLPIVPMQSGEPVIIRSQAP